MVRGSVSQWVLIGVVLAASGGVSLAELPTLEAVLERLTASMGDPFDVGGIHTLHGRARCTGPAGEYETEVTSTRDGRVWFRQQRPPGPPVEIALLGSEGVVMVDDEVSNRLDPKTIASVLGHEFQATPLWLSKRLSDLSVAGRGTLQGREVFVLTGLDAVDNAVRAFVDARGYRLLGLEWSNPLKPDEPVLILFESWARVQRVWLANRVTVLQGTERFRFHFHEIQVNQLPEERLRAWERAGDSIGVPSEGDTPVQ